MCVISTSFCNKVSLVDKEEKVLRDYLRDPFDSLLSPNNPQPGRRTATNGSVTSRPEIKLSHNNAIRKNLYL